MGGFLRFLAFAALLIAILVLVVLPIALSPILTQAVRDMGLRSDSLQVTVALLDPTLVLGRARSLRVVAEGADLSPANVGSMDVTFGDVSFLDRSWQRVTGELTGISLTVDGNRFGVGSLTFDGDADSADVTAQLTAAETENLVLTAAARQGMNLERVEVRGDGLHVSNGGVETAAQLAVLGGALVLSIGDTLSVPLLLPDSSEPWRLTEAWISSEGLNVRGVMDTTTLVAQFAG